MVNKYVISGASGFGKTSVVNRLSQLGYYTIPEAALYLIEQKREEGVLVPERADRDGFQREMLELQLRWDDEIPENVETVFLDRGTPDGLAYFRMEGREPFERLVQESQKDRTDYDLVFHMDILIDENGNPINKKIPLDEAIVLDQLHFEVYTNLGYNIVRVPFGSISERTEFILGKIK